MAVDAIHISLSGRGLPRSGPNGIGRPLPGFLFFLSGPHFVCREAVA